MQVCIMTLSAIYFFETYYLWFFTKRKITTIIAMITRTGIAGTPSVGGGGGGGGGGGAWGKRNIFSFLFLGDCD